MERRKFTREFKLEAVKLIKDRGVSYAQAAEDLGVHACRRRRAGIVTEWEQFRALDLAQVKQRMKQPVIVDLRNIYRPEEMERGPLHL